MAGHVLFEWSWHHFNPLGKPESYLPILEVLGEHEGQLVAAAREDIGREAKALGLGVGLGKRAGENYPDLFRDRADVWRFTGALLEPGLVDDEIHLSELGHGLLRDPLLFAPVMTRQALRLSFPRGARARTASAVPKASEELEQALAIGPGVNVVRAWTLACGCLRAAGEAPVLSGEEVAGYLSGATSLAEVPDRVEALRIDRAGGSSGFPDVSAHKKRQGRELALWLEESGALRPDGDLRFSLDPPDREFSFVNASVEEMLRWNRWWGSLP
jgi:hypothetical protein